MVFGQTSASPWNVVITPAPASASSSSRMGCTKGEDGALTPRSALLGFTPRFQCTPSSDLSEVWEMRVEVDEGIEGITGDGKKIKNKI